MENQFILSIGEKVNQNTNIESYHFSDLFTVKYKTNENTVIDNYGILKEFSNEKNQLIEYTQHLIKKDALIVFKYFQKLLFKLKTPEDFNVLQKEVESIKKHLEKKHSYILEEKIEEFYFKYFLLKNK